jgi:hypothetical protein
LLGDTCPFVLYPVVGAGICFFLAFLVPSCSQSNHSTMANVLQGGDGMMGGVGGFPLEQWFYEMPVCTRWWMTAALSASVLVQCHIISPFQLFYSVRTVFFKSQVSPFPCLRIGACADTR